MSVISPVVLVKAETGYPAQPSRVTAFKTSIQAQKNDACFASSFRVYQLCFNG
jgi:hypothetical protein